MFDRFAVAESPSPVGVRGVVFALAAHAAILGLGLRSSRGPAEPTHPEVIPTIYFPPAPIAPPVIERPPVANPGPIVGIPEPPAIEPGPISAPVQFSPGAVSLAEPGVPADPPEGVYEARVVDDAPELLSAPPARYPEMLRLARIEGVAMIEGVVDTLGRMEHATLRVVSSPHPAFSAAALESLGGAVFRPGRVYGRAVRVLVRIPVRFTLGGR